MSKDLLILNILLLFLPLGFYMIFWDPLFTGKGISLYSPASESSSISAYRGQIDQYNLTIKTSKDLVSKYTKLKDSYNTVDKSIILTIKKSIPDTIEEIPFVSSATKLIEKNGLDAGVVTLASGPDLKGVRVSTYRFTTKGSYEAIKDLISAIEQNVQFMSFRTITLVPPAEIGDPYELTAEVDIYRLR